MVLLPVVIVTWHAGKRTAARLVVGDRVLLDTSMTENNPVVAWRKRGSVAATVTDIAQVRATDGHRVRLRYRISTDVGVVTVAPIQTFPLAKAES